MNTVAPQPAGGSARPKPDRPPVSASINTASPKPLCPADKPPNGRIVPGGSVANTAGSRLGFPCASSSHSSSNCLPALCRRLLMPLVVIDAEMSTRKGVPEVGIPAAIGFGVNTARVPPNGATLCTAGSELDNTIRKPSSVARNKYPARPYPTHAHAGSAYRCLCVPATAPASDDHPTPEQPGDLIRLPVRRRWPSRPFQSL